MNENEDSIISKIALIVADFDSIKKSENSPRWIEAVELIAQIKEVLAIQHKNDDYLDVAQFGLVGVQVYVPVGRETEIERAALQLRNKDGVYLADDLKDGMYLADDRG
jgi:hypothetical protein